MSDPVELRISSARAELEQTLDAIEDKLNVPKQAGRLKVRAQKSYKRNPVPWIIGATTAVVTIGGLIAWAILNDND